MENTGLTLRQKKELRSVFRKRREEASDIERLQIERECLKILQKSSLWQKAEQVLVYCSYGQELPTGQILRAAKEAGKRTAVPKVLSEGSMEFFEISSLRDCESGFRGIPEPRMLPQSTPVIPEENALMLLPGLAFGRDGSRLGYGGGFYDRYLQRYPDICTVGLCFPWALLEAVPTENTDAILDWILTPEKLWRRK